jgi:hypothetical protein
VRVSGRGNHGDRQVADPDDLPIGDRLTLECHRVGRIDQICGTVGTRKGESAGDVVVVQMSLGDMGDGDSGISRRRLHSVDVTLWINDERDRAVVHQIAAISQLRGFDNDDVHGRYPPSRCFVGLCLAGGHAPTIPPGVFFR